MQVQVKGIEEKKEKVFHPFVLEFKIESEQDLIDLWCRFKMDRVHIGASTHHTTFETMELMDDHVEIWNKIDDLYLNKPYMK